MSKKRLDTVPLSRRVAPEWLKTVITQAAKTQEPLKATLADGTEFELPWDLVELMRRALEYMCQGRGVTLVPVDVTLSSREFAEMMGTSRVSVVARMGRGEIPFHWVNNHRYVYLEDALNYMRVMREQRNRRWLSGEAAKRRSDLVRMRWRDREDEEARARYRQWSWNPGS